MAPTIFLIRHGEQDAAGGSDLTVDGFDRARYLPRVFGDSSQYNIGYIIAERPMRDGTNASSSSTVAPLAATLGIVVDSFGADQLGSVANAAKTYHGDGNVLVCFKHEELSKIAHELGVSGNPKFPGDRYDIIWAIQEPYHKIAQVSSEAVPGLDD
ncbi:hypothetical protein TWF694_003422 [Orbilia ellipsospora]|uniref:Phosphoglycerate mutase family protein n=1 Tax=Orbilia ellipsospora TaxID=2528407 RepID=A0AAV9WY60_9PEZI